MSATEFEVKPLSRPRDFYELRAIGRGFELRGGKLRMPMFYRETEPAPAIHLVGFLSQRDGSVLRVFDRVGQLIETRRFQPTIIMHGVIGGLEGPK